MPKPQARTLDGWLGTFAGWSAQDREFALKQAADVHKWTSAAERRLKSQQNGPGALGFTLSSDASEATR